MGTLLLTAHGDIIKNAHHSRRRAGFLKVHSGQRQSADLEQGLRVGGSELELYRGLGFWKGLTEGLGYADFRAGGNTVAKA